MNLLHNIINIITNNVVDLLIVVPTWIMLIIIYLTYRKSNKKQNDTLAKLLKDYDSLSGQVDTLPTRPSILAALQQIGFLDKKSVKMYEQYSDIIMGNMESDYRNSVIRHNSIINLHGMRLNKAIDVDVDRVFIPLRFKSVSYSKISTEMVSRRKKYIAPVPALLQSELYISKEDIFSNNRLIMILGGPGCGKSTLLQHLVLSLAQNNDINQFNLSKNLLPILIVLRKLTTNDYQSSPIDVLVRLSRVYEWGISRDYIENLLLERKCVVMFDGLDEVIVNIKKEIVIEWIDIFRKSYPGNYHIITSRMASYVGDPMPSFKKIQIADFQESDVRQFCKRWFSAIELSSSKDEYDKDKALEAAELKANSLIGQLYPSEYKNTARYPEHTKRFQELAKTPLLLTLMAIVFESRGSLPDDKLRLYSQCVDILLDSWDAWKHMIPEFSINKSLPVLQKCALYLQEQGLQSIENDSLTKYISSILPDVGITTNPFDTASRFLNFIRDRSGLLVGYSDNTFGFQHLTFQEYLTAVEIKEKDYIDKLVKYIDYPNWREVINLYSGISDITNIMHIIINESDAFKIDNIDIVNDMIRNAMLLQVNTKDEYYNNIIDILERYSYAYNQVHHIYDMIYNANHMDNIMKSYNNYGHINKTAIINVYIDHKDSAMVNNICRDSQELHKHIMNNNYTSETIISHIRTAIKYIILYAPIDKVIEHIIMYIDIRRIAFNIIISEDVLNALAERQHVKDNDNILLIFSQELQSLNKRVIFKEKITKGIFKRTIDIHETEKNTMYDSIKIWVDVINKYLISDTIDTLLENIIEQKYHYIIYIYPVINKIQQQPQNKMFVEKYYGIITEMIMKHKYHNINIENIFATIIENDHLYILTDKFKNMSYKCKNIIVQLLIRMKIYDMIELVVNDIKDNINNTDELKYAKTLIESEIIYIYKSETYNGANVIMEPILKEHKKIIYYMINKEMMTAIEEKIETEENNREIKSMNELLKQIDYNVKQRPETIEHEEIYTIIKQNIKKNKKKHHV